MKIVTTEQMRTLDAQTIAAGTPVVELMERAGFAVARHASALLRQYGGQSVLLFAGKGNNGGDAIVAARHLAAAGYRATLVLLARRTELSEPARAHLQNLLGVEVIEPTEPPAWRALAARVEPALVVDGLLGTGLAGEVRQPYAAAIEFINTLGRPVLAIDLPSGLDSDTGQVRGVAVRADLTVTLGLPKIGLLQPAAAELVGQLEVAEIGFAADLVAAIDAPAQWLTAAEIRAWLPARPRAAHKGDFGHLLVVAGSEGYTGAPVLCAQAAARSGVGLVSLAVPRDVYPIVAANCPPEIMPCPLDRLTKLGGYDAVAIGPGLGQDEEVLRQALRWMDECRMPLVIDADGLNALARNPSLLNRVSAPLVLTPHPGEMGRLANKTADQVQAERWDLARQFAVEYKVVLALKGAGTVVTDATGELWINSTGNAGMAKAGMGDVLTGLIGGLLAQGLRPLDATRVGVFIHGLAGDVAVERWGQRALQASDLIACLGEAFALRPS